MSTPALRIGFVPGVTLTKWRRVWAERYPRLPLEIVAVAEAEQRRVLADGRVDLCFVRLPVAPDGLHLIPLYEEVAVVVAAADHPLALYAEVSPADLADEPTLTPTGPAEGGGSVTDPSDLAALVASGAGVWFVPESVARTYHRRDLVYRPVTGREPTRIGLAWLVDDPRPGEPRSERIEDFIGVVRGRTVNSSRSRPAPGPETRRDPAPSPRRTRTGRKPRR